VEERTERYRKEGGANGKGTLELDFGEERRSLKEEKQRRIRRSPPLQA